MNALGWPARERAKRELQNEIVAELERAGAPVAAIHYTLTVLLPHSGLTWAQVSQRIRRAKEKRTREAFQRMQKPDLKRRCVAAFKASCAYCERIGTADVDPDGKAWELDRIFPGRLGGEYEPSNVALSCHSCNQKKLGNFTGCPPPSLAQLEAA